MNNCYYINLPERTDRKKFIENQFKIHNIRLNRVEAIKDENGAIGCGLSHIKILEDILNGSNFKEDNYSIILEDDFYIIYHDKFTNFLKDFEKIKNTDLWDVILLTPRGKTINENNECMEKYNFKKIIGSQTATGYILKNKMIPIFIENFKEGIEGLKNNLPPRLYAIDQIWKKLQTEYNFYYYKDIFAGQLPSYSDIERKEVDYNQRYLEQYKF
jgi:glycosyl transferase family 25